MELDAFDRKILTLLQKDSRMPQRDIGDGRASLGLGGQPPHRRHGGGRASSGAPGAIVDPAKVGRPITIIVEVTVESERLDLLDAVKRRLLACPRCSSSTTSPARSTSSSS